MTRSAIARAVVVLPPEIVTKPFDAIVCVIEALEGAAHIALIRSIS